MKKIILSILALIITSFSTVCYAWVINIWGDNFEGWLKKIEETTMEVNSNEDNIKDVVNEIWTSFLKTAKLIISALLVVFIVYNWAMMVMSMWTDDDALNKSKRQFAYTATWLFFVNVPWTIISALSITKNNNKTVVSPTDWFDGGESILLNDTFKNTIETNLIGFIQIIISAIAIWMIIIAAVKMLTWRGEEQNLNEAKAKFLYSSIALVFVWVMQLFKDIVFNVDTLQWESLFNSLANLALFFAAPVAISFIILAGYKLITSNGDEQKKESAKNIVQNTFLAVLILLSSWAILAELNF